MESSEQTLTLFTTRMRQMILQYKETQKENSSLRSQLEESNVKIQVLEESLAQMRNDYNSLKMAKMVEVADEDIEAAQKRLSKLIREVNKCITLLNDK